MAKNRRPAALKRGALVTGLLFGLLTGGAMALFPPFSMRAVASRAGRRLHGQLAAVAPRDAIAAGFAEGKAAAHQRHPRLNSTHLPGADPTPPA